MKVEITIPGELPDLNEIIKASKSHFGAYSKMKSINTEEVAWGCLGYPKRQLKMPVDVTCKWVTKNLKKDPDNVSAGVKFILDGLVLAGILHDDRRKQVNSIIHKFGVDKHYPRVEITITEVEPDERNQQRSGKKAQ